MLQATDKIQSAFLDSISQDLRTPLVSIQGALSFLQQEAITLDETARQNLIDNAAEEADRLNCFIRNLLDVSRLEAGAFLVKVELYDIEDVIGSTLECVSHLLIDHPVDVRVAPALPFVPMDGVLIIKALVNVLENAIKYSAPGAPIEVLAQRAGINLEIVVADRGVGIPSEDLSRVFDKFYRVPRYGSSSGTGLGLAICKSIVEIHGGTVAAENRKGGGTLVNLRLPMTKKDGL